MKILPKFLLRLTNMKINLLNVFLDKLDRTRVYLNCFSK